jgi:hypothetical protein
METGKKKTLNHSIHMHQQMKPTGNDPVVPEVLVICG